MKFPEPLWTVAEKHPMVLEVTTQPLHIVERFEIREVM
jgi:hypothetical protein